MNQQDHAYCDTPLNQQKSIAFFNNYYHKDDIGYAVNESGKIVVYLPDVDSNGFPLSFHT